MHGNLEWVDPAEGQASPELLQAVGGSPLVADALHRRGLANPDAARAFLDPERYNPAAPTDLTGVEKAAARLADAARAGEVICVWGDFDVDGLTSTSVLVSALRTLGADVRYHIPSRQRESHGVNLEVLRTVIDAGTQVLLTCDTGIQAHEAAEYALGRGVQLIITDHHDPPGELPRAFAIVNPKLMPAGGPLTHLPGAGCAYLLAQALFTQLGNADDPQPLLDLVALGIVADVARQRDEVRYLLQRGLDRLRRQPRRSLISMMELAEIDPAHVTEQEIGFDLAPRLNALGRLSDARPAVEFLLSEDQQFTEEVAAELQALNARRKGMTDQVVLAATRMLDRDPGAREAPALVLHRPDWPAGVIGLVAGRLAERYRKPVVLIAGGDGGEARGSARSVEGVDISAAIRAQQRHLTRYGGHPMAAGFSLPVAQIPSFRAGLVDAVRAQTPGLPPAPRLALDAYLDLEHLSLELVREMERLAPFGPGNPPVTLASRGVVAVGGEKLGRSGEHRKVQVRSQMGGESEVLWWNGGHLEPPKGSFDLAYQVRSRMYRGEPTLQIEWVDARTHALQPPGLAKTVHGLQVIDLRSSLDPMAALRAIHGVSGVQIWNEAQVDRRVPFVGRDELGKAAGLVVWSPPAGQRELIDAVRQVEPQAVYLFALPPPRIDQRGLLEKLAGAAKYAMRTRGGEINLPRLAAKLSQRVATVEQGLRLLEAQGLLLVGERSGDELHVAEGSGDGLEGGPLLETVQRLLRETAAFREFYARASPEELRDLMLQAVDRQ